MSGLSFRRPQILVICHLIIILFRNTPTQLLVYVSHISFWLHGEKPLTHLPLDKMAAFLADNTFKCIFLNENDRIPIQIWQKCVSQSPIDNKPAAKQATSPYLKPMLTQFTDAYMRHYGEMS